MDKLLIIDGHNYLYRGYYGVPSAAKLPNGLQINAFYGFFSCLRKNIQYVQPNNIVVVFDSETGIQSKLNINENYKQNRDYTDTGMFEQLPIIKQALKYMNIPYIEDPDNEGDDIIGSISYKESNNKQVYISTQDQDFFQLISDFIYVLRDERIPNPKDLRRYINNPVRYESESFKRKWGFSPENYLDYIALKGDPSDNIKGVEGIGKIRASNLVKDYGDIDIIIQKSKEKRLVGNEQLVRDNKEFLKVNINLDINYKLTLFNKEKVYLSSNRILEVLDYIN